MAETGSIRPVAERCSHWGGDDLEILLARASCRQLRLFALECAALATTAIDADEMLLPFLWQMISAETRLGAWQAVRKSIAGFADVARQLALDELDELPWMFTAAARNACWRRFRVCCCYEAALYDDARDAAEWAAHHLLELSGDLNLVVAIARRELAFRSTLESGLPPNEVLQ